MTQTLAYRFIPFPVVLSWEYWRLDLGLEGAIAGALMANLGWTLVLLRLRMRRSAAFAIAANTIVWIAFLVVTPPLTPANFDAIQEERNRRDADSGIDLTTHEPVIVAARMLGTYGANGLSERLLQMFALPAIQWTALLAVPLKYGPARATRPESYTVAAGGFILSTAFWAAFAPVASSLVRFRQWYRSTPQRRRSQKGPLD